MHVMVSGRARVLRRLQAYRGTAGDRRWVDWWWSGLGGDSRPGDVHAGEMVLARVSKTSRWAPVIVDDIDELRHCLDQAKEGRDLGVEGKLMSDAWWMTSPLGTPRGRCDEYSSSFSLNYETKVYRSWRGETNDWRGCLLVCDSCGQFIYGASSKLCLLAATQNLHTHKQILCSQLTMRMSISPVCLKQRLWVYRVENSKSMRVK
jgi:hypothetical protein